MSKLDRYGKMIVKIVKERGRIIVRDLNNTLVGFLYSTHHLRNRMRKVAKHREDITIAYLPPYDRMNLLHKEWLEENKLKVHRVGYHNCGGSTIPCDELVERDSGE